MKEHIVEILNNVTKYKQIQNDKKAGVQTKNNAIIIITNKL